MKAGCSVAHAGAAAGFQNRCRGARGAALYDLYLPHKELERKRKHQESQQTSASKELFKEHKLSSEVPLWPHLDVAPAGDPAGASSGSDGDSAPAGAVVAVDLLDVLAEPGANAGGGGDELDEPPAPSDLVVEFSVADHEELAAIEAEVLHRQRVYRQERRRAPHASPSPVVWEKRHGSAFCAGVASSAELLIWCRRCG